MQGFQRVSALLPIICVCTTACNFYVRDNDSSGEKNAESELVDPLTTGVQHPHPVVSQRQGERIASARADWSQRALRAQTAVSRVHAMQRATCARKGETEVKCWGLNSDSQLGVSRVSTAVTAQPTQVQSLREPLRSFSAGLLHVCAVTRLGAVKCFGDNASGQLGVNSSSDSHTAISPAGLSEGVLWVASGETKSCAVLTNNSVRCWGAGKGLPEDVPGADTDVFLVAVGANHQCLLNADFGVQCWGSNDAGQLGTSLSVESVTMPLSVNGLSSGVVQVAAGHSHSCALLATGSVWCWGKNDDGQLGDGGTENRSLPVEITALGTDVTALSLAGGHSCALKQSGGVWCWGNNDKGQLGDGTLASRTLPAEVLQLQPDNIALSAGNAHVCALDGKDRIQCWGEDRFGELGAAATDGNNIAPVSIVDF